MSSFVVDRPVAGPGRYFGREQQLRSLASGLATGRSFLLCGGPSTGRSSTLQQLVHLAEVGRKRLPGAGAAIPVLLDLARLRAPGAHGLVAELYDTICRAVVDPRLFGNSTPVRPPELVLSRSQPAWESLAQALGELWRALEGTAAWRRYDLLVDGGDQLLSPTLETEQQALAAFIKTDAAWAPRAAIITVGRALREQLLEAEAPFAFARPIFLGVLKDSEATSVVSAPFDEVDEELVTDVLADSGKHPYLLQLILAEHERRKFEASSEQVAAAIRPAMTALFERVWQELDLGRGVTYRGAYAAPEHAFMLYVIEHGEAVDLKTAEGDLGIKPLKEFAELLDYCGVLERVIVGNATCYRAPGRLWNAWYAERVRE